MHVTLDTILFGTGFTVLTILTFIASFGAALGSSFIVFSAIRWFPIYVMRKFKYADTFSVTRGSDGRTMAYKNGLIVLNVGYFSIVLVNGKSCDD